MSDDANKVHAFLDHVEMIRYWFMHYVEQEFMHMIRIHEENLASSESAEHNT